MDYLYPHNKTKTAETKIAKLAMAQKDTHTESHTESGTHAHRLNHRLRLT